MILKLEPSTKYVTSASEIGVDSRSGRSLVKASALATQSCGFPSKANGINSAGFIVLQHLIVTSG